MPRRFAGQVHKQASRYLQAGLFREEPAWYQAVLENPPLPLPPRAPPSRTAYDLPRAASTSANPTTTSSLSPRPLPVTYTEDKIRRQFFQDHPFEAFRPVSLIEGATIEDEHPIRGKQWTRLRQRGRNPTAEDAVRFAVNLHENHDQSLTHAYSAAVAQFRSLRSEHEIAITTARLEADALGIKFGFSSVEAMFNVEEKALNTWGKKERLDASALAARKRWKAIIEKEYDQGKWSRGKEYVRLWQEGVRPDYLPVVAEQVITPAGLEPAAVATSELTEDQMAALAARRTRQQVARQTDFLDVANRPTL